MTLAYSCHGEPAVAIAAVGFCMGCIVLGILITLSK